MAKTAVFKKKSMAAHIFLHIKVKILTGMDAMMDAFIQGKMTKIKNIFVLGRGNTK